MQLGIWKYDKNHELPPHFHNEFERKSYKTNEFVFVAKGKLQSDLYTEQGEFIETVIVDEGEGILLHNHAHHYKILEDSIILESKNGPFMGVEKDKTVIMSKNQRINQVEPLVTKDAKSVYDYLTSGGWVTEHNVTREFEKQVKDYVDRNMR